MTRSILRKGFTLVELLIVIGIISVLAVVALVAINPQNAQRKARDTQRLKDMSTLLGAITQHVEAGGALTSFTSGTDPVNSSGVNNTQCVGNWTTLNLCSYINRVPVDPSNSSGSVAVGSSTTSTKDRHYYGRGAGSDFKLSAFLESNDNYTSAVQDGGNILCQYEVFNSNAGRTLYGPAQVGNCN